MRRWPAFAGILAMACSAQTSSQIPAVPAAPVGVRPTAPAASSPNAQPTAPTRSALACRVPVMSAVRSGDPPGGWITLPGGTFQSDRTSNIDRTLSSEGISYDRAFNRWIPADWNHISPDGRRYVVLRELNGFNIVEVANGATRGVSVPPAHGQWIVIDYTTSGIYLTLMAALDYADPGLWVMNPDSGQVRKLDATQSWSHVDSRAAWGVAQGDGTLLLRRLDLETGTLTTQLAVSHHRTPQAGDRSLELIALDADGRPLVLERDWEHLYPWHMATLEAPSTLREITLPNEWSAGWPMFDNGDPYQLGRQLRGLLLSRGIWIVGRNSFPGLALLGPEGAITQWSQGPEIFAIAGGCY